ncbi:TPM domain-containing protein [Mucilaginibacter pedocola]|uniref:TPM domain-containing protein n=1 Tax=Mucilaginibacter pedocola TaxID=1792845 RepID=A0A1S9PDL1_9SPHI|nr:TPM domain-containing protein [Mucilaginibacter pedocola]OOQ59030.1 hypothetical protein BC343_29805 [Mucilaginibacter pedocola]
MKRFLIVCLLFVTGLAAAQIPQPKKNTFVNDYANLLTADDIKALNEKLYVIQKQAGVQVAIVLVKKVPSEFTIERFATRIGRKWHVGTKKRGVVYVAAIDDHLQRLAIAENLQASLTDQKCEEILAEMKPSYRNEDYNGGLTILVNSIHTELIGPIATPAPVAKPVVAQTAAARENEPNKIGFIIMGFGVLLTIYGIIKYFVNRGRNRMDGYYRQGGNYGGGYGYGGGTVINNYNNNNGGGRWYRRPYGFWGSNRYNGYSSGDYSSTSEPQNRVSADNNPSNWGNWGSGDSGDSGFSDSGSSSSRRSSSSSSSSSRSSSSDSSGFSDRGGSSGGGSSSGSSSSSGGATSSW